MLGEILCFSVLLRGNSTVDKGNRKKDGCWLHTEDLICYWEEVDLGTDSGRLSHWIWKQNYQPLLLGTSETPLLLFVHNIQGSSQPWTELSVSTAYKHL